MLRIGLLSDTHGYLDDRVKGYLSSCNEIWHAGDFGPKVAEELSGLAPLRGVYGNIDGRSVREAFPERLLFQAEEVTVLMQHIGGYPGKYAPGIRGAILDTKAQLFISGHSHILKVMYDEGLSCLHMNPGAAGKQGWHQKRTLLRFSITGKKIHDCEVVELGGR